MLSYNSVYKYSGKPVQFVMVLIKFNQSNYTIESKLYTIDNFATLFKFAEDYGKAIDDGYDIQLVEFDSKDTFTAPTYRNDWWTTTGPTLTIGSSIAPNVAPFVYRTTVADNGTPGT